MHLITLFEAMGIVAISAVLQVSTGFGFSIFSAPFLITLFPPREGIFINLLLTLLLSLGMFRTTYSEADKPFLGRLVVGSLLGIPIGLLLLTRVPIVWIKVMLAVAILLVAALLVFRLRLRQSRTGDVVVGVLSGLLTTSVGVPGPPLLAYTAGVSMGKERVRSTTLSFYIVVYFVSIFTEWATVGVSLQLFFTILSLVPSLLLGMWLGQKVFKFLSPHLFRGIQYAILFITGAYLLFSVAF